MYNRAIENGKLPESLELALIMVLLNQGKTQNDVAHTDQFHFYQRTVKYSLRCYLYDWKNTSLI